MALITLQEARDQARIDGIYDEADVLRKMEQATTIALNYIKRPDADWTVETVPPDIKAAILLVFEALYDHHEEIMSKTVTDLLVWHRDPTLA